MTPFYYLVALSPDGKTLAVAQAEGEAELWSLATGKKKVLPNPAGLHSGLWELTFSKSGALVAAARPEGITVWDVPAARVTAQIPVERIGNVEFIDGDRALLALAIPKDYKPTVVGDNPQVVRMDVAAGKPTSSRDLGIKAISRFLAPGGQFAAIEIEQVWSIYDVAARAKVADVGLRCEVAFSGNGLTLVCCEERKLSVREVSSGKELRHFELNPPFDLGRSPCLSVSFDGKLLAAGRHLAVNSASLISLESGKLLATVECGPEEAICRLVQLSADGSTFATMTMGVDVNDRPARPLLRLWRMNATR